MKIKIYKMKISEFIICILLLMVIFSEILSKYISNIFSYCDELFVIFVLILSIIKLCLHSHSDLNDNERNIVILYIVLSIIGIIGNNNTNYQKVKFAIIIDWIGWLKFFAMYVGCMFIIKKENANKYYNIMLQNIKIILVFFTILEILSILKVINLSPGYVRFGIQSFSIFGHPSAASSILAAFIGFLLFDYDKNKKWVYIALILSFATFRFKAIVFCLVVLYTKLFLGRKISFFKVIFIISIAIIIAWPQIKFYFLEPTASRARALNVSIKIANDNIPLGSRICYIWNSNIGKIL